MSYLKAFVVLVLAGFAIRWLYRIWATSVAKKVSGRRIHITGTADCHSLLTSFGAVLVGDPTEAEFRIRINFDEVHCEDTEGNHGMERVRMYDKRQFTSSREVETALIYIGHFIERSDSCRANGLKGVKILLG